MEPTLDQFAKATGATLANAAIYYDHALVSMARFQIKEPHQIAAFLGSMSVETQQLSKMEEDLYYKDAARLAGLFRRAFDLDGDKVITAEEIEAARPYTRNPKALSKKLYNGYHGRGGAQLTWERNYAAHSLRLGIDYLNNPQWVLEPVHAMLTAASFWDSIQGNSIAHDMDEVTLRWNGPKRLHLAERIARRDQALTFLA